MNKIIKGIALVGFLGAVVFGVTQAYFSDTETSTGNVLTAGKIDLKIDHTRQTYNDVDCKTCSVVLISDPTNMVVAKDGNPVTPFPAVYAWTHAAWTAEEDPDLDAAGAEWIWATNPTTLEDAQNGAVYTFRKEFTWFGPILDSDLWFAVGSDNSVEVWLNGVKIGENLGEFGYKKESMLHIAGAVVTGNIVQGNNILEFKVNNFPRPGQDGFSNPGGLVYKFEIDGNCEDDFFKINCRLWGLKDLAAGDYFWKFDDVKPGDRGLNVISYHVYDNDAYICTYLTKQDLENVMTEPESPPDIDGPNGELSKYLEVFVWKDDGDGNYEAGEGLGSYNGYLSDLSVFSISEPPALPVTASTTRYLGFAWCFGDLTVSEGNPFLCDGIGNQNDAQTDVLNVDLEFNAEQSRNNPNFTCSPAAEEP